MTRDILLDLLGRRPFAPLSLTLTNGDGVEIDSPETVRVGRNYLVVDHEMLGGPPGDRRPGEQRSGERTTITLHHVLAVTSRSEPKLEDYEKDSPGEGH